MTYSRTSPRLTSSQTILDTADAGLRRQKLQLFVNALLVSHAAVFIAAATE